MVTETIFDRWYPGAGKIMLKQQRAMLAPVAIFYIRLGQTAGFLV
jgi:hypothetical protein